MVAIIVVALYPNYLIINEKIMRFIFAKMIRKERTDDILTCRICKVKFEVGDKISKFSKSGVYYHYSCIERAYRCTSSL